MDWCTRIDASVDCAGVVWPEIARLLVAAAIPMASCQRVKRLQHGGRSVRLRSGRHRTRGTQCRVGLRGGIPLI